MEIEIRFYAGYKGEETPRALVAGGIEYPIERILSRRRCEDKETGVRFDLFRCLVNGKKVLIRKDDSGKTEILPSSDLSFLSPI
jgi:hypothetical protein